MDNKIISNWIRQARYRAKSHEIFSDLEIEDVQSIVTHFEGKCAYCERPSETLDHPFPLKTSAPNIPANVLPTCKICKGVKKNNDIVWMFGNGHIPEDDYLKILEFMFRQRGGDTIKKHVRRATGMIDE
jgi:hypothetical protein